MSTTESLTYEEWELLCTLSLGKVVCAELVKVREKPPTKYLFATEDEAQKFCDTVNIRDQQQIRRPYPCSTCLEGTGFHFTSKPKKLFIPAPRRESSGNQKGRRPDYTGQGANRHRTRTKTGKRKRRR